MIRRLDPHETSAAVPELAAVLEHCVANGASIGFMPPFTQKDAAAFYEGVLPEIESGKRILLAAYEGDELIGSVQVVYPWQPNQPHRGDITKLVVHAKARGRGVGRELMEAAEREAANDGKALLVLDTVTDSPAYRLYTRLGWVEVGEIPDFALYPDGTPCATTFFYKRVTVQA